jgi:hypothetical protein
MARTASSLKEYVMFLPQTCFIPRANSSSTDRSDAWVLADAREGTGDNDSDGSASESEEDVQQTPESSSSPATPTSTVLNSFLTFLQLACNGNPISSYPAVPVLLVTIPTSVLPMTTDSMETLFNSFWAAIDGRVVENSGEKGMEAFTTAVLEAARFIIGKSYRTEHSDLGREVATKQVDRLLKHILGMGELERKRPFPTLFASQELAKTLVEFERTNPGMNIFRLNFVSISVIDVNGSSEVFAAAWSVLSRTIRLVFDSPSTDNSLRTSSLLRLRSLVQAFEAEISLRQQTVSLQKLSDVFAELLGETVTFSCKALVMEDEEEGYIDAVASFLDNLIRTCPGRIGATAYSVRFCSVSQRYPG